MDEWDDELDRRTDQLFAGLKAELDDFADGPAPAEIRRRGEQRRTRRRTAIGAAALGVAALAVVGGVGLTQHDSSRPPTKVDAAASSTPSTGPSIRTSQRVASPTPATATAATQASAPKASASSEPATPSSTPSDTASASTSPAGTPSQTPSPSASTSTPTAQGALDWGNLADATLLGDGLAQVERSSGSQVQGDMMSWCQGSLSTLGASDIKLRYLYGSKYSVDVVGFDFPTADQASAARGIIRGWFSECQAKLVAVGYTNVTVSKATELTPAVSITPSQISYRTVTGTDLSGEPGYQQHLLLQAGKHLEWFQFVAPGDAVTHKAPDTSQMPGTSQAQAAEAKLAG